MVESDLIHAVHLEKVVKFDDTYEHKEIL